MITVGWIIDDIQLFKVGQQGCNLMKNKDTNIIVTTKVMKIEKV